MTPTVTLYSRPGCQPCKATKRWLDKRGVAFTEVDLATSPDDLAAVQALGYEAAPVVVVSQTAAGQDVHWAGFRPDRLAEHVR